MQLDPSTFNSPSFFRPDTLGRSRFHHQVCKKVSRAHTVSAEVRSRSEFEIADSELRLFTLLGTLSDCLKLLHRVHKNWLS